MFPYPTAVLLENFSIFYNEDDTELSHGVVEDFKQNWLYFDKKASVSSKQLMCGNWNLSCSLSDTFRELLQTIG